MPPWAALIPRRTAADRQIRHVLPDESHPEQDRANAEKSFSTSEEPQFGHCTVSSWRLTSNSNVFPHPLQLYSNIGISMLSLVEVCQSWNHRRPVRFHLTRARAGPRRCRCRRVRLVPRGGVEQTASGRTRSRRTARWRRCHSFMVLRYSSITFRSARALCSSDLPINPQISRGSSLVRR